MRDHALALRIKGGNVNVGMFVFKFWKVLEILSKVLILNYDGQIKKGMFFEI